MAMKRYSILAPEHIMLAIEERGDKNEGGRGAAVWRALARYLAILNRAKVELREKFSREECALILDSLNGVAFMETVSIQLLAENIVDGIHMDKLDKKWQVDGQAIIEKMRALTYADKMAIVDSVSLWWDRVSNGEQPDYGDLFLIPEHDRGTNLVL